MPRPHDVRFFATAAELRAWLEANHDKAVELWLGYHHKSSPRHSVGWPELVDEALCFGWIDSVRYPLGDHSSATRLTPRRKRSVWSNANVRRFRELEEQGRVQPSGRAVFEARDPALSGIYSFENRSRGLDDAQLAKLKKDKRAWRFFASQPPSYRSTAAYWVVSAKRPETRERRLTILIESSRDGERIPPLRPRARSHA